MNSNPGTHPNSPHDVEEFKEETKAAKPKRQINRVQLNESTLLQQNKGLKRLYQLTKDLKSSGNTKQDLRALLNMYKEWHFIVAPKFEFNYFVQKCQVLGTKAPVRGYMNRLREFHSGRINELEFDNPITMQPDDNYEQEQVYETPEKLLNSARKNKDDEMVASGEVDQGENSLIASGVNKKPSPKVLDYFDLIEENDEAVLDDEMEYLRLLENGEFQDEARGDEQDEMEYLQELALEGSGKRIMDLDEGEGEKGERMVKEK
jgi:hypothetical protein